VLGTGACVVSPSTPARSSSSTTSSSSFLVNFTYINVSTGSSSLTLAHATSTLSTQSSAVDDQLTSPATEPTTDDVTGHVSTSRDLLNMHNSSAVAAVALTAPVSSSANTNDLASSTTVPTPSSLPADDNVTSISSYPSSTVPDAGLQTTSSLPNLSGTVTPEYFRPPSLWMSVVTISLCLLAFVVLFVILIVCLLRARSRHKLCWTKHRCYLPVPLFYQNGSTTAVILDASASGTATTVVNGTLAKGPELAPLTCV